MHQLAGYVLAIRGVGVSMAPEHIKTIDLVPGEGRTWSRRRSRGCGTAG